jgi:6-phosphofructokinase 2
MKIATITLNPALDENTQIDVVTPERKLRCARPTFEPGGGGINVARAIHLLGGEALALWTRGGPAGGVMQALLGQTGIASLPIEVEDATRTNVIVYEESTRLQYRFGMPGPRLSPQELERCAKAVAQLSPAPDYLVISGSLPPGVPADFCATLVRRAPKHTRVVVDTSGEALRHALEAGAFLVKPNLRELSDLVGEPLEDDEAIRKAACRVVHGGSQFLAVSLGAGGALLASSDDVVHVRSPTVPIRSKVGAGDSMVAWIVLALARGLPVPDALRFGVAAGAAAVMTPGTALCTREDTERLFGLMQSEAA